jgi:acyl-CoA thioesterase YciA
MATVAVNQFIFKQPVRVGDILSLLRRRHPHRPHLDHRAGGGLCRALRAQGHYVKVTEASLTYVAIDDQGRPRPIERPEP